MLPKPLECRSCPLDSAQGFIPSEGGRKSKTGASVLLLGEAGGAAEEFDGVPFVGAAGEQLRRTLERLGKEREDFSLGNVLHCRPPGNKLEGMPYAEAAIAHCDVHFRRMILKHRPTCVVAAGNVALKKLLGLEGILDRRCPKRGYVYDCSIEGHEFKVVPTPHPAFVMRGAQKYASVLLFDIQRALEAAESWEPYRPSYMEDASEDDLRDFLATVGGSWVVSDIETPETQDEAEDEYARLLSPEIVRISFSNSHGKALSTQWRPGIIPLVQRIFDRASCLCSWNAPFDTSHLRDAGLRMPTRVLDSMYLWHWLQSDLPKALGFVAPFFTRLPEWKSKARENPNWYNAADSDATWQITMGCRDLLQKEGRLDAFLRHHLEVQIILDEMGRSGVLLDQEVKSKFSTKLGEKETQVNLEIQNLVPDKVKPKKRLKQLRIQVRCAKCSGEGCKRCKQGVVGKLLKADAGAVTPPNFEKVEGDERFYWQQSRPFLPLSSPHVNKYLTACGYSAGATKEDLQALSIQHPKDKLLRLIVESRELHKMASQYINGLVPSEDGRIRTHFNRNPSTWRTASYSYNVQNLPRRYALARNYRRMFVPAPGYVLAESDFRSIEAILAGWYAGDEEFIRASKLGLHAILASHVLKRQGTWKQSISVGWDADKIAHHVARIKKEHQGLYDKCKVTAYLSIYLGSPAKMVYEYPDTFENTIEARQLQDILFSELGAKIKRWQRSTLGKAQDQHFLETPLGYKHYFWDALTTRGKLGSQAKEALAFLPQATAAGVICEALLRIAKQGFFRRSLRWIIHDSLLLELPNDRLLGQRIQWVKDEMQKPIPELRGLVIPVEVKVSASSWGEMKEFNEERTHTHNLSQV